MISLSSITDRLKQLTIPQKIVLAVGGMVFLGVVLGFFLLMPLWEESKNLREDISREKIKLAQIIRTRAQITRFKQELAEMDARYIQILVMLP